MATVWRQDDSCQKQSRDHTKFARSNLDLRLKFRQFTWLYELIWKVATLLWQGEICQKQSRYRQNDGLNVKNSSRYERLKIAIFELANTVQARWHLSKIVTWLYELNFERWQHCWSKVRSVKNSHVTTKKKWTNFENFLKQSRDLENAMLSLQQCKSKLTDVKNNHVTVKMESWPIKNRRQSY